MAVDIDFAIVDSVGKRSAQEDFASYVTPDAMDVLPQITVVADGMGGHAAGEIASKLAAESFLSACQDLPRGKPSRLWDALHVSNAKIADYTMAHPEHEGMGCTLVAVEVQDGARAYRWISVGDSLLLSVTPSKIERLNEDHSFREAIGRAEAAGESTAGLPSANVLKSAVMGAPFAIVDDHAAWRSFVPHETLVLATDGLDTLSLEHIRAIVNTGGDAKAIATALISAVEEADKPRQDNTTIAVLKAPPAPVVVPETTDPSAEAALAPAQRWISAPMFAAFGVGVMLGAVLLGGVILAFPEVARTFVGRLKKNEMPDVVRVPSAANLTDNASMMSSSAPASGVQGKRNPPLIDHPSVTVPAATVQTNTAMPSAVPSERAAPQNAASSAVSPPTPPHP